ncbi:MAG: HD-GYP domain-containing protein [Solirubrobacterales bacterium]|nr:HD-GYP domain-containing protein [Solirubrobacterales bacterium]
MVIATTVVAILPLAVSLALRASGAVSGWVSVGLAVVTSLAASTAGNAFWRKRGGEVLFGELLLWGWIRSWRQERELANATRLLHLVGPAAASSVVSAELSVEEREHLLRQLAGALEGQDVYLNGHSHRVARHATMIARGMGLCSEDVARVRAAAAVHDVGKLRTPKSILNKPGRLTDAEFEVIKRHPVDGAQMVAALGDPELTRIVRHHHERLDGAGYPDRLKGEDIPVGARIIAVADTFDAVTSARPYREAAPHQKAIDILRKEAGAQLDPDAVHAFLAYYSGSRPTIVWAIVTSSLRRVIAWLSGDPAAAATLSASKVAAATAATAAIGAAAGVAPVPVVHNAARPAHAHSIAVRPHTSTTGLRRNGAPVSVSVTRPAAAATAPAAHTSPPARSHRVVAHTAAATRRAARSVHSGGRTNHAAARAGSGFSATAAKPAGSASGGGSGPVNSPASQPSTSSGGNSSVSSTGNTAPPQTAPVAPSQGSSANGNAYGHTKVLGDGHGKGQAKGHDNTSPAPSPVQPPTVPVSVSAPSNGNDQSAGHGQGNNGDGGHGHGNANGHDSNQGNGNGHGNASASAVAPPPSSVAVPSPGNSGQDNAAPANNGNGSGNGGHGQGKSHG